MVGVLDHHRDRLADLALDVAQPGALLGVAQRDRPALSPGARGAADAVDVALGHVRQVVVDDVGDAVDVDAARRDVGCDEDGAAAVAEVAQRPLAQRLGLVAVDRVGAQAAGLEVLHDAVRTVLGAREDQRAAHRRVTLQQLREQHALSRLLDEADGLLDPLGGGGGRVDRDANRVAQQRRRERGDLLRHGGREEQRLARRRQQRGDASDRDDVSEVEHVVRLVEHQDLGEVEPDRAVRQMVEQAAGCRDEDVDAALDRARLSRLRHAAEHQRGAKPGLPPVVAEAGGDLGGEFARRGEDEHAAGAPHRRLRLGQQPVQDRQREGRRLAGARLGDALDVAAGHHDGDRLRLDRRRRGVVLDGKGAQKRFGEAEFLESGHERWPNVADASATSVSGQRGRVPAQCSGRC